MLVWNCSCLAKDVEKLFDVYWYLSKPDSSIPPVWPPNYTTSINMSNPAVVSLNNTKARIYISVSSKCDNHVDVIFQLTTNLF